jgi:hypothetical protein
MAIMPGNRTSLSIEKFLEAPFAGKQPKLISKGTKAAAAEAAVTSAEAIAVEDLEEAKRLAAEFEALGDGALTMALAQEAEPGNPLRKCWLAHERLRVSETRSRLPPRRPPPRKLPSPWKLPPPRKLPPPWNLPPPRGALRKPPPMRLARKRLWRPSCRKSLAAARAAWPRALRKPPGGPCFVWGGREELKTRGGSLSSEGKNGNVQAERPTPIKILRSLEYSNALILKADTTFNIINGAHLHGKRYTRIV